MQLKLTHDPESDAAYVYVTSHSVARTQELDENRAIDLDANGEVRGIELLNVSYGVKLDGLPFANELATLFKNSGIRELASPPN